jgi:membrane dipeptidase
MAAATTATTARRPVEEVTDETLALHRRSIVIDGCSFFLRAYNDRVRESGLTAANFTVPLPEDDLAGAVSHVRDYYEVARRDPHIRIAWSVDVIEQCKRDDALAAIIGCQNSRFLGTELANIEMFARLGMRVVQLTYNERNFAGDGCLEPNDAGLSFFGRRLIAELELFGLVLDLSHCGLRTSMEALAASKQPVIISHAGMRALTGDNPRCLTDDQLRAVAATGGVVGVTSYGPFNWRGGAQRPTLDNFLEAIEYAVNVAGIDHVGIGTDNVIEPGGYPQSVRDRAAMTYGPYSAENAAKTRRYYTEVTQGVSRDDQLDGFAGMQHLPRVTQGLLDRGYAEADVQKIIGGNLLRVFRQVWKDPATVQKPTWSA